MVENQAGKIEINEDSKFPLEFLEVIPKEQEKVRTCRG